METSLMLGSLSDEQHVELRRCEDVIARNLGGVIEFGQALTRIRDERLYRETHKTFEEYLESRWDVSRATGYRAIDEAKIWGNLSPMGDAGAPMPNSRQSRELAKIEDPEQQREVWREAVRTAPGGKVTAAHVEAIAAEMTDEDRAAVGLLHKHFRAEKETASREERMGKLRAIEGGNRPLDLGMAFPVIYADPPWRYEFASDNADRIENHYPTMTLEEICALPVAAHATDDAILFLWTTSPKLAESMAVIEAWGFGYRTCAIWDKQHMGMGYYFRQQHELLLVATRGAIPVPAPQSRPPSVFSARKGAHSAKPLEFYGLIEAMYPDLPKLELFCRSPQPGWESWGNESEAS